MLRAALALLLLLGATVAQAQTAGQSPTLSPVPTTIEFALTV